MWVQLFNIIISLQLTPSVPPISFILFIPSFFLIIFVIGLKLEEIFYLNVTIYVDIEAHFLDKIRING